MSEEAKKVQGPMTVAPVRRNQIRQPAKIRLNNAKLLQEIKQCGSH